MLDPIVTPEFEAWYRDLDAAAADLVDRQVAYLEEFGVALRYPYSSAIPRTRNGIRELRVRSTAFPLRIFYAFDWRRDAVMLLGGTKKGTHNDARWTRDMAERADVLMDRWLEILKRDRSARGGG